ncbi:GNAT family N-acetyltransferase [Asaia sp. BMEF1]|uniref:GNAT family N-acetyltransferase n=1 Tax=Asaia sp. BMEF1 TaxID=3155932 RepID=UPI003F66B370
MEKYYRPMRESEFSFWATKSVDDYEGDLIINHLYDRKKAYCEARKSFETTLPNGFNTKNHYFRIFEQAGEAVGFLWFSLEDDAAFLLDIMVLEKYQGQGIGRRFIRSLIEELANKETVEIELRVSPTNHGAIKIYEEFGFRITGFDMSLLLNEATIS